MKKGFWLGAHLELLRIENRIIDWLTAIMWFIEVRTDHDNRWFAKRLYRAEYVLISAWLVAVLPEFVLDRNWAMAAIPAVGIFLAVPAAGLIYSDDSFFFRTTFPQGTPNPARITRCRTRRIDMVMFLWGLGVWESTIFTLFVIGQGLAVVTEFMFACDSMPPGEKARRKAANEMRNGVLT